MTVTKIAMGIVGDIDGASWREIYIVRSFDNIYLYFIYLLYMQETAVS